MAEPANLHSRNCGLEAGTWHVRVWKKEFLYEVHATINGGKTWRLAGTVVDEKTPLMGSMYLTDLTEGDRCQLLQQIWKVIGKRELRMIKRPPAWFWTDEP